METINHIDVDENLSVNRDTARKQIRGSSLLLLGKFISVGLNFASQVLIVRYLAKSDFGAWTYTLAIIAFFNGFSTLGLRRAITRFVPIYHEQDQYNKLFGTILLVFGTIVITGLVFIAAVYALPEFISGLIGGENQPVRLLLILIFLVPLEAIDGMLIGLFASFASPRIIFTRKFIFGPGLRLTAVLLLIVSEAPVLFLAYGYLAASAVGVLIYSWILLRFLQSQDILQKFQLPRVHIPAREIFAFSIPLLTSDLVTIVMYSIGTLILGYFHGTAEVASFRVILPAAHLNKLVMTSFAFLFTPLAARLFAKDDIEGINDLYWQTAIWLGVLSFPIFVLTFSLAKPLTLMLYGARYEQSWFFLQLLSLGYYFNVALGFNGLTLKVLGHVRYVVIINLVAVTINAVLCLLLIPRFGALGAALATAGSMILHNILKQTGLRLTSGIRILDRQYLSFFLLIAVGALGILLFQFLISSNIFILIPVAAVVSLLVMWLSQEKLQIQETFPEISKLPIIPLIFRMNGK
jgi:O-antigen/teichoic acid export membrane protein